MDLLTLFAVAVIVAAVIFIVMKSIRKKRKPQNNDFFGDKPLDNDMKKQIKKTFSDNMSEIGEDKGD